jgi:hypothetical protein
VLAPAPNGKVLLLEEEAILEVIVWRDELVGIDVGL